MFGTEDSLNGDDLPPRNIYETEDELDTLGSNDMGNGPLADRFIEYWMNKFDLDTKSNSFDGRTLVFDLVCNDSFAHSEVMTVIFEEE